VGVLVWSRCGLDCRRGAASPLVELSGGSLPGKDSLSYPSRFCMNKRLSLPSLLLDRVPVWSGQRPRPRAACVSVNSLGGSRENGASAPVVALGDLGLSSG